MQHTLCHEQTYDGFAVGKITVHTVRHCFGEGHAHQMEELVFIGVLLVLGKAGGQINGNTFVAETGRSGKGGEQLPVFCAESGFFFQFTLSGFKGVFSGFVQRAGGNFKGGFVNGHAVLAHKRHIALGIHRNDSCGTGMQHDFAGSGLTVRQAHLPLFYMNDFAVKNLFR